jgi:hypothetical protein
MQFQMNKKAAGKMSSPFSFWPIRDRSWYLVIFALASAVFLLSPVEQVYDSHYSMLLSEHLVTHQSFALDDHFGPNLDFRVYPGLRSDGLPRMIRPSKGHLYYYFPPGSSVLSAPFVKLMNSLGVSATKPNGSYDRVGESRIQRVLASLLMAIFTVIVFAMCRLLLVERWGLVICFSAAFGTQVWSTASRAMWSHTWELVLIGLVVYQLLAHEVTKRKLNPILLATLLAWAYFTRPTSAIAIGCVGLYLLIFARGAIISAGITLGLWLCVFMAYSWIHFETLLPSYFAAQRLGSSHFWTALAGNLISPSRGLLVFVPQLLFVVYLLVRYWKFLVHRRLIALCVLTVVCHWLVVSTFSRWWGGYSYGPRLMTDTLPWFIALAIIAVRGWMDAQPEIDRGESASTTRRMGLRVEYAAGALLLMLSLMTNANGALHGSSRWYQYPYKITPEHSERLWDWRDPQFLTWATDRLRYSIRK